MDSSSSSLFIAINLKNSFTQPPPLYFTYHKKKKKKLIFDSSCSFFDLFAKMQKVTISFVITVCLSIHLHGTAWLPLDTFLWNLIFEYFSKAVIKFKFHYNLTRIMGTIHEDLSKSTTTSWWILLKWKMFQTKVAEKMKTYTLCSLTFFAVEPDRPQMHNFACWITKATGIVIAFQL